MGRLTAPLISEIYSLITVSGTKYSILFMIWNIDGDPQRRASIFTLCLIVFIILAVYSILWTKLVMKRELFKPVPLEKVMAMENDMYMVTRRNQKLREKEGEHA